MPDLVILRHGRSQWNELNLFTGWHDVDLAPEGEKEATAAGELLRETPGLDLRILHTSVLTRSIRTAEIALHAAGRSWLPVKREWRLNERHYGDLTGKDKKATSKEFGEDQVKIWRRSYDVPPPSLPDDSKYRSNFDPRYRDVAASDIPSTESLKDVHARIIPYFETTLAPDLRREGERGGAVIVVAHGNSLRALTMLLKMMSPDEVTKLEIPTGIPFRYRLDESLRVIEGGPLGDAAAAAKAAEDVARQADGSAH